MSSRAENIKSDYGEIRPPEFFTSITADFGVVGRQLQSVLFKYEFNYDSGFYYSNGGEINDDGQRTFDIQPTNSFYLNNSAFTHPDGPLISASFVHEDLAMNYNSMGRPQELVITVEKNNSSDSKLIFHYTKGGELESVVNERGRRLLRKNKQHRALLILLDSYE
jgi:hypothetical protein